MSENAADGLLIFVLAIIAIGLLIHYGPLCIYTLARIISAGILESWDDWKKRGGRRNEEK